jgi:hypothetical protein
MTKLVNSTRYIKKYGGNTNMESEKILHPVSLQIFNIDKSNNSGYEKLYNQVKGSFKLGTVTDLTPIEISKFISLPYININREKILSLYKINDIHELMTWIDESIKEASSFQTVNRIVNIWIKFNYYLLKNDNDVLIPLYEKINKHYWNNESMEKTKEYILYWFKTKDINDFKFNLGTDLDLYIKSYLKKKST